MRYSFFHRESKAMKKKTGIEDYYIIKNNKKMRFGYTTGTCAAAAAEGAAAMLLDGEITDQVRLTTPKGIALCLELIEIEREKNRVTCGVRKDAGDDPDVTDGIVVKAAAEKIPEKEIRILRGEGVGLITKAGLEQPVGSAAVNRVPREMIRAGVGRICERNGYDGGISITLSVPGGREIAEKTFNPRLGIEGGISILGTSGIVEPMSETALIKSIEVELRQQLANGRKYIVATLGNYGRAYLDDLNRLPLKDSLKCSNYVGEVIDMAVSMEAAGILFVAHIGKFIKVAGGIMNTHSRNADCRAEIMAANAMRAGLSKEKAMEILSTVTTEEALDILKKEDLLQETMKEITDRIAYYLNHRSCGRLQTEALIFSNASGYLGETAGCSEMIGHIIDETEHETEQR